MAFTRKYQCSALMRKNLGGSTTIYFPCFDMEIEDTFRFSLFRRAQAAANEALANYVRKNRCVPPPTYYNSDTDPGWEEIFFELDVSPPSFLWDNNFWVNFVSINSIVILFLSLRGFDFIGQLPYSLLPLAVFVAFCFFIRFVSKCIVILLTSEGNDPFYGRYDKTLLRTILILVTAFVPYVIVLLISLGQQ